MVPMSLASLPGVGAKLSWREYHFLYHHMGWLCLALSFVHVVITSYKDLFIVKKWPLSFGTPVPTVALMSVLLPGLVLALKAITVLFWPRLWAIKSGKHSAVRSSSSSVAQERSGAAAWA
jgi:hypothetical protein